MSFLEHLDELRARLMHSAIAILVIFAACWSFSPQIYNFLERPVQQVLVANRLARAQQNEKNINSQPPRENEPFFYTFEAPSVLNRQQIPAGTTIQAVVKKNDKGELSIVTADDWVVGAERIPKGSSLPATVGQSSKLLVGPEERLVIDTVPGAFNLYVRVSFYAALFFTVPYLLYQIWAFISPGLYPHERKWTWPFVFLSSVFFLLGMTFAYTIAFPRACGYLLGLSVENFRPLIKAEDYFDLITTIMLGLGLVFQIPAVTFVLARLGLVTPRLLLKIWRPAIVVIFILAAILSPTGDVPNMMVFAAPMLLLYYLSVAVAWLFGKPREIPEKTSLATRA